jgi:hypothetical protein
VARVQLIGLEDVPPPDRVAVLARDHVAVLALGVVVRHEQCGIPVLAERCVALVGEDLLRHHVERTRGVARRDAAAQVVGQHLGRVVHVHHPVVGGVLAADQEVRVEVVLERRQQAAGLPRHGAPGDVLEVERGVAEERHVERPAGPARGRAQEVADRARIQAASRELIVERRDRHLLREVRQRARDERHPRRAPGVQ